VCQYLFSVSLKKILYSLVVINMLSFLDFKDLIMYLKNDLQSDRKIGARMSGDEVFVVLY